MDAPIRSRREADLDACVVALRAVHLSDGYPHRWPEDPAGWLSPSDLLAAWVAERGERVVGHVTLRARVPEHGAAIWSEATGLPPGRLACVSRLFTAPDARGGGVGAALLRAARERAHAEGRRAVLDVVDTSLEAIAMYERRGWRCVGSVPWASWGAASRLLYYVAPAERPA